MMATGAKSTMSFLFGRKKKREKLIDKGKAELLQIIKEQHDEINQLKLTIRARNVTIRELRMRSRTYYERIKKLRAKLERIQ